jgi:hypothetical protein
MFIAYSCQQLGPEILSRTFETLHMMPDQVRHWVRQHSKFFYAAGLDALVKRWDKRISVGGAYVENIIFKHPVAFAILYINN